MPPFLRPVVRRAAAVAPAAARSSHDVGAADASDAFDELGEGQVARVLPLGADVAHDRVTGHLEERRSCAEEEEGSEEQGVARHDERGDEDAHGVERERQDEEVALADARGENATGHAQQGEGDERERGQEPDHETGELEGRVGFQRARQRADRVGETHGEERQEDGERLQGHRVDLRALS